MPGLDITRLRELHKRKQNAGTEHKRISLIRDIACEFPALLDEVERLRAELVVTQRALNMNSAEVAEARSERDALVEKAVAWMCDEDNDHFARRTQAVSRGYHPERYDAEIAAAFRAHMAEVAK